ncbi:MAG TPA: hypothetical protein VGD98_24275 [Ktedonobacteraceae bacterium]
MLCPRCGTEWDARKSSCVRCGFSVHTANFPEPGVLSPLQAGQYLRRGRYRLQTWRERRSWLAGIVETNWNGYDYQPPGGEIRICEVILPDAQAEEIKVMLRGATHTLLNAGKDPAIPALKDVFNDQGRVFFVFAVVQGESLQARLRRLGRVFAEQEALALCFQINEVLGVLTRQAPPLVHGFISPEHIVFLPGAFSCILDSFSPMMAGGITWLLRGITDALGLPYMAPEFTQGVIDVRSDLYALLATVYYAVTGVVPQAATGEIPPARRFNSQLSPEFSALLSRGLHPLLLQRYQHPAELQQDLLTLRSRSSSGRLVAPTSIPPGRPSITSMHQQASMVPEPFPALRPLTLTAEHAVTAPPDPFSMKKPVTSSLGQDVPPLSAAQPWPVKVDILAKPRDGVLVPSPETLPQLPEGHERLEAALILIIVLLGLGAATVLGSFHF